MPEGGSRALCRRSSKGASGLASPTQPAESGFATIKAILVDLSVEAKALRLLDQGEYFHTFNNLVESSRISMGIPTATYSKLRR